jgi:hypothetical protein
VAVTFSLSTNDPDASLVADFNQAAAEWTQYLASNATIRVQVDVGGFPDDYGYVIQNDSSDFVQVGATAQGEPIVEPWGEYALQTDSHVAGSPYDIHIYLNLDTNPGGAEVYLNPDPANGATVPYGEYDATTMFLKALGYGLGFAAMTTTNTPGAASQVTPLDPYVELNPNGASDFSLGVDEVGLYVLTGAAVENVYGGPVPLVTPKGGYTEAYIHMGNTPTIGGTTDIMAVTQSIAGVSLGISALDLAIMQEAGVPLVPGAVACFAAGTRIATPRGAAPIEALREGDAVVTAAGKQARIQWIGWRHVDCRRHQQPEDVWPVRIAAGAFGDGRPASPLFLSPDHAVFIAGNDAAGAPGVLIPIRYLVNGASIAQRPCDRITYWHIELDEHAIILANGLACESYLDTGNRAAFANGGTTVMMNPDFAFPDFAFPDFAFRVWQRQGCAKLVLGGPRLAAAKRLLLARARTLGHVMTDAPRLRVLANGIDIPVATDGQQSRAVLPPGTVHVRLVSRTWIPAEMRAAETDTRALGVALARLRLDRREVDLASPGLTAGWYQPEPKWRWTDGDAHLAVQGVRELAFELAMTGLYWDKASFDTAQMARA